MWGTAPTADFDATNLNVRQQLSMQMQLAPEMQADANSSQLPTASATEAANYGSRQPAGSQRRVIATSEAQKCN